MNFHDFILSDIEEKKNFLSSLPQNTKPRRKKYMDTIGEMMQIYNGHKEMLANYMKYKYEKLLPEKVEYNIEDKCKELIRLKRLLVLGNPDTSYVERLTFDVLLYEIMHYYDYSLPKVNDFIEHFINKFKSAGITLKLSDFKINIYAYVYMSYFFNDKENDNKVFENIFWLNQKVIEYIVICFRQLMNKHSKKLEAHAKRLFKSKLQEGNFNSYEDVKLAYVKVKKEIELLNEETEYDIVNLCLAKSLDINSLVKGSNVRESDYDYFMIDKIDLNDANVFNKFISDIKSLRYNLEEYNAYLVNTGLIDYFKEKYKGKVDSKVNASKNELKIKDNEIKLLLKKISKDSVKTYSFKNIDESVLDGINNDKLFTQQQLLDELYKKYIEYNDIYFNSKVEDRLKVNMTVADVFELFEAYPYYERRVIKKIYELSSEEDIDSYVNRIKDFIYNPNRKIIDMITIFVDKNIPQQLMNAFRFENLNITTDSFEETNLNVVFEKSERILRGIKVDKFKLSPEEISFLVNIKTMMDTELL